MSPLSRTFWLGTGLILLTNAVVLGGVAYNRSGEPLSQLQLSERELQVERSRWMEDSESSGLVLNLDHRVAEGWVTADKLQALGFPVWRDSELESWSERSEREALVVLEFDGPAFQAERKAARTELAEVRKAMAPDSASQTALEAAQYQMDRLDTTATRLYIVDAGTDAAALRQRYPDRSHYAIAKARLRYYTSYLPAATDRNAFNLVVEIAPVSVPRPFRGAFDDWTWRSRGDAPDNRVRLDLAFGRRFEPWILAAERVE